MISNERPWASRGRPFHNDLSRPHTQETTLQVEHLQVERKTFIFCLKENPRGRFLRITEDVSGRHQAIIIPTTGLEDFAKLVQAFAKSAAAGPPSANAAQPPSSPP